MQCIAFSGPEKSTKRYSKMSNDRHAKGYQRISSFQREDGKQLIESIKPCLGDVILDLGCGTGELSVYLAELVGEDGKVVAVDPDIDRIELAQESHKGVKNLTFFEGSSTNFLGMGSETYDIVFANYVLHWIPDKAEAFENMFSSLKPNGKIALQFNDHLPHEMDQAFREFNPENLERILSMYHFKSRSEVEKMCIAAGFHIVKSEDLTRHDRFFENCESLLSFLWATTHGAFDPRLATKDRLAKFFNRYATKEQKFKILFAKEGYTRSTLIAIKPVN